MDIKLLIVDDHKMIGEAMTLLVDGQKAIKVIGHVQNGKEAIEFVSNQKVDVILMDINMPVMNGIEATKIIKKKHPEVQIICLTMLSEKKLLTKAIENGATGYLLKNSGKDEVIMAIQKVISGQNYFDQSLLLQMVVNKKKEKLQSPFPSLSKREKVILKLIMDEKTNAEIAEGLNISISTVESHRRNMMMKMGAKNTAGLVRIAMEYDILGGSG